MDDDHTALINLQIENEELKKVSSMKDEQISELEIRLRDLESRIDQISQTGYEKIDDFIKSQFSILSDERKKAEDENINLKKRLLHVLAKKHGLKNQLQAFKIKCVPFSPKSPSGLESENQKLNIQVSDLRNDLQFTQEQLDSANEEIQNCKKEIDELKTKQKNLIDEATDKFLIVKNKLNEEREKMKSDNIGQIQLKYESLLSENENNNLKHEADLKEFQNKIDILQKEKESILFENETYKENIKSLNESKASLLNGQTEFLNSLSQVLSCQSLEEALVKIRELALLPEKYKKLQEKIESENSTETHSNGDVVNALKVISENLSPNNLKLPHESTLSNLFASLCNMFDAALNPSVSKNVFNAYIISVVHQARNFVPEKYKTESTDQINQKYNFPPIHAPQPKDTF